MRNPIKPLVVGSLLLLAVGACADLEVVNYNSADAARALATPGDVESLIAGTFNTFWTGTDSNNGPGVYMSNQSFQHNAPWANFGMEQYGRIPRIATQNNTSDAYYSYTARIWTYSYRAIAAATDGLKALDNPDTPEIAEALGPERVAALKAYGKFVQGLGHAALAMFYDQAFILNEETDLTQAQEPVSYQEVMTEALGELDEAIARCNTAFTLDYNWMSADVDNQLLARLAHSYKARFRAQMARNPAERAAVDWDAVITDADAGVTEDFTIYAEWDVAWYNSGLYYGARPDWGMLGMYLHGMADTSGNYQRWLALTDEDKSYAFGDGSDVLIITPDLRYPQGATRAEQFANIGTLYRMSGETGDNTFARPDRGTWRWSWYKHERAARYKVYQEWDVWEFYYAEMRLLKAEGLYRKGAANYGQVAAIINETRVPAGLNATDAAGTNTSCVPKLPNGQCGDLWEMLKWEKRHGTVFTGLALANWWFDGRGWGDLYKGTPLQYGIPCQEVQVLQMEPCVNYGGPGGEFGSPGSTYAYPHEG
jgi:hypothetical protein